MLIFTRKLILRVQNTVGPPVANSRRLLNARKNHCSVSPVGRSKNMRGQVKSGEHNLHPMVDIGSTDLSKSGRGCVLPAHAGSDNLVLPPQRAKHCLKFKF